MPVFGATIVPLRAAREDARSPGAAVAGDEQLAVQCAAEGVGVLVLDDAVGRVFWPKS